MGLASAINPVEQHILARKRHFFFWMIIVRKPNQSAKRKFAFTRNLLSLGQIEGWD